MIGIFDSGVGGMTVARAIEQLCPGYPLVYFGDIARTPYGSKSPETIVSYAIANVEFLRRRGAQLIVIACNSAASAATETLRRRFDLPILEVISPAVRRAVQVSRSGRIGVIGTRATIASEIYKTRIHELQSGWRIFGKACPLLVPLVEEGWLNRRETKMILRRYLHRLRICNIDTLVLGCTHYPLLKHLIAPRIGRKTKLIDSSVEVAGELRRLLENDPALGRRVQAVTAESAFFVSDITDPVVQLAETIFGRPIHLEKVYV